LLARLLTDENHPDLHQVEMKTMTNSAVGHNRKQQEDFSADPHHMHFKM
jgi:hypothetical protein